MTHDEHVRPCSICSDPDAFDFEGEMFLCEKCREAYEPMTPGFMVILTNEGSEAFCDMLAAYQEKVKR